MAGSRRAVVVMGQLVADPPGGDGDSQGRRQRPRRRDATGRHFPQEPAARQPAMSGISSFAAVVPLVRVPSVSKEEGQRMASFT